MAARSRSVFGDITNGIQSTDAAAALGGKKTLKSERKADDVDARDATNPQAVTEYVNDMSARRVEVGRRLGAAVRRERPKRDPNDAAERRGLGLDDAADNPRWDRGTAAAGRHATLDPSAASSG